VNLDGKSKDLLQTKNMREDLVRIANAMVDRVEEEDSDPTSALRYEKLRHHPKAAQNFLKPQIRFQQLHNGGWVRIQRRRRDKLLVL
jgi:hypothetical protein